MELIISWLVARLSQDYILSQCFYPQVMFLPRGKVLGGSSSINYMIYMRGNAADYDGWAAGGADGWSYEDVLPYFKKAENNRNHLYKQSGWQNVINGIYASMK